MECNFNVISGLNKDCEAFLATVKAFAITHPAFSFDTKTAATKLAKWADAISEVDSTIGKIPMFLTRAIHATEGGVIEPVSETDGFGVNFTSAFNPPTLTAHMSSNPCDFAELLGLGMQNVRVIPILEDNSKMGVLSYDGKVKGFAAQMIAIPVSLPGTDNRGAKTQQYKVTFNFNDIQDWTSPVVWNDNIGLIDYLSYMPVGYTQEITSALSIAGAMSVLIFKRGDKTLLSTDTWTVEYGDHNCGADRSISVGAITNGVSVLTCYSTGTTPLVAGEYIKFRLVVKSTDTYTKMTNWLIAKL